MSTTIETKYLGEIEISIDEVIEFPVGLPGFSNEREFILLELPGNPTFQILQSMTTSSLAFVVTNPYHFYMDYTFKLDEQIQESLAIEQSEDVLVLSIVTLKSPFKKSTLNLKAPIIIHSSQKIGKQYILKQDHYETKAPIVSPNITEVKGD